MMGGPGLHLREFSHPCGREDHVIWVGFSQRTFTFLSFLKSDLLHWLPGSRSRSS